MGTVGVCTVYEARPARRDELVGAVVRAGEVARDAAGCLGTSVFEAGIGALISIEVWDSASECDAHRKAVTVRRAEDAAARLADSVAVRRGTRIVTLDRAVQAGVSDARVVHAVIVDDPHPGREAELRRALLELAGPTRDEAGCLAYDIYAEDTGSVFMYEAWLSQSALDEHLASEHVAAFMARKDDLLAAGQIHRCRPLAFPASGG